MTRHVSVTPAKSFYMLSGQWTMSVKRGTYYIQYILIQEYEGLEQRQYNYIK